MDETEVNWTEYTPGERPLTPDEILLLESLIKSPVYAVLQKVIRLRRAYEMAQLLQAKDADQMRIFQGRIHGLNLYMNLPKIFVDAHLKQAKELQEKKKAQ